MPISIQPSRLMQRLPEQFFAQLTAKAKKFMDEGYDVINLGQGNPDLPTPPHIVESLREAALNPKHHRYPPFRGLPELKEAVAFYYESRHGVQINPEREVAILFGAKTGLVEISPIFLNPGDIALVPDPGYPDYWSGIAMAGGTIYPLPLEEKNGFLPDFSTIPTEILERAKLLFLNYPNNPTGAVAPLSLYEEAIRLAKEYEFLVLSDFAYGEIAFDGHKPISFLQVPGAKEVGIEFYTLSKTYNMAGWRVGFALGNPAVVRLIEEFQDHLYVSLFGAVQEAAVTALTSSQACVEDLRSIYQSRRDLLFDSLKEMGWQAPLTQGTFFAWIPVPKGFTSLSFADYLLERAHLVAAPGIGFGSHGEGYVRVGLLTPEERLLEAIERMKRLGLPHDAR
ncbi:methionine-glutamine aminotransferase [[Clostridium] ultunense Esp]|nr:methionine-glutamine aminotransferase [[Clostridium] ultunense Esp]